jgi:hypothetical protein
VLVAPTSLLSPIVFHLSISSSPPRFIELNGYGVYNFGYIDRMPDSCVTYKRAIGFYTDIFSSSMKPNLGPRVAEGGPLSPKPSRTLTLRKASPFTNVVVLFSVLLAAPLYSCLSARYVRVAASWYSQTSYPSSPMHDGSTADNHTSTSILSGSIVIHSASISAEPLPP